MPTVLLSLLSAERETTRLSHSGATIRAAPNVAGPEQFLNGTPSGQWEKGPRSDLRPCLFYGTINAVTIENPISRRKKGKSKLDIKENCTKDKKINFPPNVSSISGDLLPFVFYSYFFSNLSCSLLCVSKRAVSAQANTLWKIYIHLHIYRHIYWKMEISQNVIYWFEREMST